MKVRIIREQPEDDLLENFIDDSQLGGVGDRDRLVASSTQKKMYY